ncbi:MAG: DNA mismatch repair endonuclease MutL [Crocinitomix sp.]|nr:DNA mismatch repair endonuclease MutL [Crocinitomix sp.]
MSDLIKLLPDHIANQIAAGEVVQRPASVVKELIENSIDAGASTINLIAKDGGRTLVQIIDNGSGMSAIDARMAFERHATSKIASADDLFLLHTKGFRGEALASIAAISHVCLRTKLHDQELGSEIVNEGSKICGQEPVMMANGTSIAVKNLFYNVPARRNFLGKNTTEYRKILEEFLRIALVHPEINMTFHHNDDEIYNLPSEGLRQRIVRVYGNKFNQRLVPVNEETDIIKVSGFVLKPEFAKTSRDQSYFFVNNRYFKDRYFNHAVSQAYEGLIPSGKFPPYFLYFEVPTKSIDVNVHPTKTEIKFEENQAIYAIIRSAVKLALGQFNIAPTLDFEQEPSFNIPALKKGEQVKMPEIKVDPNFNPFKSTAAVTQSSGGGSRRMSTVGFGESKSIDPSVWENFYGDAKATEDAASTSDLEKSVDDSAGVEFQTIESSMNNEMAVQRKKPTQINEKYILTSIKNGFLLIDQYRAHCRILYDQYLLNAEEVKIESQQLLFAEEITVDKTDLFIWKELSPALNELGFETVIDKSQIIISAVPTSLENKNPQRAIIDVFEGFKVNQQNNDLDLKASVALSMASALATKGGNKLTSEEMQYITDALFASSSPQLSPHGKKIIETFTMDEITKRFN